MDYQTSATFALHRQREQELVRHVEQRRRARERGMPVPERANERMMRALRHALDSAATALHLHRSHVARPIH